MTTSKVTRDADAIVSEIDIAVSPERVFQALLDPKQVVQGWGQEGVYRCKEFHSDLHAGGRWHNAGVDGQGQNKLLVGARIGASPVLS